MARYRQIAETLEEGIRRGDYVSRLPSVRLLGELFQANSRTVLRALRELSAAGLIVPNGNQGFRIGPQGGGRPETGNIAPGCFSRPGGGTGSFSGSLSPRGSVWLPSLRRIAGCSPAGNSGRRSKWTG